MNHHIGQKKKGFEGGPEGEVRLSYRVRSQEDLKQVVRTTESRREARTKAVNVGRVLGAACVWGHRVVRGLAGTRYGPCPCIPDLRVVLRGAELAGLVFL
jgi:hypothetical protein